MTRPQKLIVRGIYRHVRNPMIARRFLILLGEAVFFGSLPLLGWFAAAVLLNVIYIPLVEEPGLAQPVRRGLSPLQGKRTPLDSTVEAVGGLAR